MQGTGWPLLQTSGDCYSQVQRENQDARGSYCRTRLDARVPEFPGQKQDGIEEKIESSQLIKDRKIQTKKDWLLRLT